MNVNGIDIDPIKVITLNENHTLSPAWTVIKLYRTDDFIFITRSACEMHTLDACYCYALMMRTRQHISNTHTTKKQWRDPTNYDNALNAIRAHTRIDHEYSQTTKSGSADNCCTRTNFPHVSPTLTFLNEEKCVFADDSTLLSISWLELRCGVARSAVPITFRSTHN